MLTEKFLKGLLCAASILFSISGDMQAVTIDPTSYCLTCKEGCAGAVKQQCERMCVGIKEHIASLQMSKLTNETGKKFRTSRNKAEKADMLHDSPLYKCLGIMRVSKTEETHAEKNKPCLAALQNVEEALNATLEELQSVKKTLMGQESNPDHSPSHHH